MSGVAKVVGVVAGVAAIALTTAATFGATAPLAFGLAAGKLGAIAGGIAAVANVGSQLTASKPAARGNVSETVIQSNAPMPYLIGRTYSGGTMLHQAAYGPTLNKVPNPYLSFPVTYSGCGPVDALEQVLADFTPVSFSGNAATGYLSGFLHRAAQLGSQPSATALAGPYGPIPGWSAASKLSGHAAILFSAKFDKDGKVFASGLPQLGAVWRGVKVYDPRLDSTYPGGSGSQRWADEATWAYSENPGLHGLTYARGRFSPNGKKLFGIGMPLDSIIVSDFVTFANVCDANGWKVGGVIYEPGNRWANLKDILVAGGAEPAFAGARLGLKINMPRVAVDRITDEDLATDDVSVGAMQSWRERLNGIVPRWRSETAKWEYVPAGQVTVSTYLAEDGEEKVEERQYNLVQQSNQAAQLAAYDLVNARELGPIEIVCKPRMRRYRPGTLVTVHLPDDGLVEQPAVIVQREVDPGSMAVSLTLIGETPAKHDFALGRTGTPPPTPTIVGFEERDDVTTEVGRGPPGADGADGTNGVDGEDGQDGLPGDDGYFADLVNPSSWTVNCSFDGTPVPGELAKVVNVIRLRKGTDLVTSGVTYSLVSATGCSIAFDTAAGQANLEAIAEDKASFVLRATFNGKTYDRRIEIGKTKDGKAGQAGSLQSQTPGFNVSAFTQLITFDLVVPADREVRVFGRLDYYAQELVPNRSFQGALKVSLQDVTVGSSGTEGDLAGSTVTGSQAIYSYQDATPDPIVSDTPGLASWTGTVAAASAVRTLRFKLYGRKVSGSGSARIFNGTLSAQA